MDLSRTPLPIELRKKLIQDSFLVVGCLQQVHNELGPGLPEYIYQEACYISLQEKGFEVIREYPQHITFHDHVLQSYMKMDLVVLKPEGNIVIECKSIPDLGNKEQFQIMGYLRGSLFPIGILVNFGTSPKAQIQRYYFNKDSKTISAF